ncbi:43869_t:CDS:2, partial [Gigaspora margarita]
TKFTKLYKTKMSSIKKRKSKYSTDSNSIPNSNENFCPENAIYISNNETSDETLSDKNISTSSNNHEEMLVGFGTIFVKRPPSKKWKRRTNCTVIIKDKKSSNGQRECNQLVKTQGSTGNFQSHLNAYGITNPTQINSTAAQPTIDEMFQNAVKQYPHQKESIECALPFYVLQSESFVKLIHTLNPYYELLSNKQIKVCIHQSYNNSIEYLKTLLVTELKTCTITILTKSCNLSVASASIKEIDLMDASDVFDNIEEDIVNLDEEFATITIANSNVIKLNQPQNTDGLVNKIKKNLYAALKYYWNAPIDRSLVATLLDPHCKSMKQLDSWKCNKAISLLQENYELLNIKNETTNSPNEEQNKDQLNLFLIMFGSDNVSIKNEVERYLKIDQDNQEEFPILASLAREYLAIPATSTPSERLFSSAGNLMTVKRTFLKPNLFERILFLQRNIKVLGTIFES